MKQLQLIGELNQTDVSVDATLLKVHILTQDKQTMAALNILKQLEEKHPFQWSIHKMSIKVFEQHLQQTKTTMEAITPVDDPLEYSSLLMTKSHWEKAIQILQNQDQIKTNSDNIQLMIARCFFEQSRYDLALQIYHRQTKETTNKNLMKSLLYLSGLCQLLQSNEEDALQSFESVSTYDQNYLNTQQLIDTLRKKKFLNHNGLVIIGSLSHDMPHYVIRKNHFGPQKKKSHQFEVIGFSQSYNDEGCKQCLKQQYKAAKESFELAIQMDPSFHIPHINLSMVYLMNNDVKMAIETIQKAETITQNCPYTVFIRGLCEIKRNDQESAIRHIQNAIKIYGKESVFHLTMGDLFYQKFQLELAKSYWKKANEAMDIAHIEQSRYRINHFDKITIEYWSTPELLFLK